MIGIPTGVKKRRERIMKNISACERQYSEDQPIKSMHKIITSLFLQISLNGFRNSWKPPNHKLLKRVSYKKCLHHEKHMKGIKINAHTFILCTVFDYACVG